MSARYLQGNRFKIALVIFLFVAIPVNMAIWLFSIQEANHARVTIEANAQGIVEKQRLWLGNDFDIIVSDLLFFANYNELEDFYADPKHKPHLTEDLALFSRGSRLYDQIRIIDKTGMETIRVNLSPDGTPVVVPEDQLQQKGSRYYFRDSIGLNQGEVFISPLDLNIERGEIEIPLKPMIRFATPVLDRAGDKQGILIFNYLGGHMIKEFKDIAYNEPGDYMLLNLNGYWLAGKGSQQEWGFMFKDRRGQTFRDAFPDAWAKILQKDRGQFADHTGLFTFETVYPLIEGWKTSTGAGVAFEMSIPMKKGKEYFWKVVSHVPASYITTSVKEHQRTYMYLSLIMTLVIGFGAWKLARQERLKAVITEKTLLLAEIHHRVKNNLQVLLSLNAIQVRHSKDNEPALEVLTQNQCRLNAMAFVQDKLYQQEALSMADIRQYTDKLVGSILSSCCRQRIPVACEVSVEDVHIRVEDIVPCGMIINELVVNSMKHAFLNVKGDKVEVKFKKDGKEGVALEVSDNGKGLREDLDVETSDTVGFILVRSLVAQLDGKLSVERNHGTRFTITFGEPAD